VNSEGDRFVCQTFWRIPFLPPQKKKKGKKAVLLQLWKESTILLSISDARWDTSSTGFILLATLSACTLFLVVKHFPKTFCSFLI